jgi:alpha-methylacyl-CoA racemase
LCKAAGQEGLASRQFDARAVEDAARLFGQKTRDEWLALLQPLNVCVEPVNTVDEARRDPLVAERGALLDLDQPSRPPRLGEHTREILCQAGYADAQIDELAGHGAVGPAPRPRRTAP